MLKKIRFPGKRSINGRSLVVDPSNYCMGCSSQFSFIGRKHQCCRCGGLFCSSCTRQKMIIPGRGDSLFRICEPCKELESMARPRSQAAKGVSKLDKKHKDDILNQLLGEDGTDPNLSAWMSQSFTVCDPKRTRSVTASCSSLQEDSVCVSHDAVEDIIRSVVSEDMQNNVLNAVGSNSPEELLQQALEEKNKYRTLKGEGRSAEALVAFKQGKELERKAKAFEIAIRKNRRLESNQKKMKDHEAVDKKRLSSLASKEGKVDISSELKELGWSAADLLAVDKNPEKMSLESELSNLLKDNRRKSDTGRGISGIDKSQVNALKRKALMLKREGRLAEAKEELKQAKILEKQLEEKDLLAGTEDSDDELSAIIRSIDDGKQEDQSLDFGRVLGIDLDKITSFGDDTGIDGNIDETDADLNDPELATALKSFGWNEEDGNAEEKVMQSVPVDREAMKSEILCLKRESVNQKHAGNVSEAISLLKKAKLLEKDLEDLQKNVRTETAFLKESSIPQISTKASLLSTFVDENGTRTRDDDLKKQPGNMSVIQKGFLALKKKAAALRREGCWEEAEEELRKCKAFDLQLEEMEQPKLNIAKSDTSQKNLPSFPSQQDSHLTTYDIEEGGDEVEVTEQDMNDPTLLSVLENLGWKGEDVEHENSVTQTSQVIYDGNRCFPKHIKPLRSKGEIQRELLGIKRKSLALRRQGKADEAEEELRNARDLENQLHELEFVYLKLRGRCLLMLAQTFPASLNRK